MCPAKSKKVHIVVFLLIAVLLLAGVWAFSYFLLYGQIPELRRLGNTDADYYEIDFSAFDGNSYEYVSKNGNSTGTGKKSLSAVRKITSIRGIKVSYWSEDNITYPIYSLKITPVDFAGKKHSPGETIVWTNGYLITSSGDVYRCYPDFRPFMEAGENDYTYRGEDASLTYMSDMRPLAMAGGKWNKEMLNPACHFEHTDASWIETDIKSVVRSGKTDKVTVSLKNTGDQVWDYNDQSIFAGLEVLIDDEWYDVIHDPNIDLNYPSEGFKYNRTLAPGEETEIELDLACYGMLPPGQYHIVIHGMMEEYYTSDHLALEYVIS